MLQVHDIRETRVYQEAKEEGAAEERQRQLQEKLGFAAKWAARKIPAADIADILGLDEAVVRAELARKPATRRQRRSQRGRRKP